MTWFAADCQVSDVGPQITSQPYDNTKLFHVITSTEEVMFSMLFVFQQDCGKTTGSIFMKLGG